MARRSVGYRIEIAPSALRELERMEKAPRGRIVRAINSLAADARPANGKKLKGTADRWRIRVGDYRVVYDIQDDVLLVLVVKIGHRRDVYR